MWVNNIKRHYERKHPDCWEIDKELYQICPHCNTTVKENLNSHVVFCLLNPNRQNTIDKIKKAFSNKKHTDITKQKISIGRKKWLKENPEKHPWKKHFKFKSQPCEYLKKKLIDKGIIFIEEYQESNDRFFSIDIAFPHIKLAIEVNGRQHYDADFKLKPYYQGRQNYLESKGWIVVNVFYSKVYDQSLVYNIEKLLKEKDYSVDNLLSDLEIYNQRLLKKEQKFFCSCGKRKCKTSLECKQCNSITKRKFTPNEIEELIRQVSLKGFKKYAKELKISDNALRKRVLRYGYDPKKISPFAHSKNS